MAQQVCVVLSAAEREQLAAIAADRNRPRKHIERARTVLASADRRPVRQVARSIGVSPTSACWLDAVENFFSKMTRQRIRRGIFRSVVDLQAAINAYVTEHNDNPKPPSSGPNPPKPFSPHSPAALYHLFESVHWRVRVRAYSRPLLDSPGNALRDWPDMARHKLFCRSAGPTIPCRYRVRSRRASAGHS